MLTAALLLVSTVSVAQERGGNQNDLTFAVTAGYKPTGTTSRWVSGLSSDGSSWTCGA